VIVGDMDMFGDEPAAGSIALARPKSSTFTVPSPRTLMFAGFRSRVTIPCSCAASRASRDLLRDGQGFVARHGSAREAQRQIVTFDEFHHEGSHALAFFEAVGRGDVWMIQGSEHFRFALKTREPMGIDCE
jgi:hypothetical protein